ncbi:helix-turn-helix transcriptional regulator [Martelella endophytica]|uniref:helix-turn-helix transcriptional regulator n=1 Tax=Martelella endophytica TaxID=1486262 RepID=UPI000695E9C7|nr:AraC family transcriptional regulator [Martelella endophytica]
MDPLSQILRLAGAEAMLSTGLVASGRWAVAVPATQALKCNVIREGECVLAVGSERRQLSVGDCFLVAPDRPFVIGTDFAHPRPAAEVFAGTDKRPYAHLDGGEGSPFRATGGRMELGPVTGLIADALPPLVILTAEKAASKRIGWLMDRLEEEQAAERAGASAIAGAAMQMIFVELIRALPEERPRGWLAALDDPRIGPALHAIHTDPAHPWRIETLAGLAHLSRSQFSARFRAAVGQAPMDYVLHWRMTLARQALTRPGMTVAKVAEELGYASESAFGAAFRRVMGTSPRRAACPPAAVTQEISADADIGF